MGIDILDIVFRLEKKFSILIERSDFTGSEEEWINKSQQENADKYINQLTVKFLCDLVEQKIQKKNKGIDSFPNMLHEAGNSVRETLSKQFNISDPTRIANELSLDQLADFSASPISTGFWQQFRTIRKDDADELKTIKSYLISREYVSAFKTLALSFGITSALCGWLLISGLLRKDVLYFLTVLFAPSGILFGIRAIVNWTRCGNKSQITVAEIINYIVDQKRDHSVRADGLPYSREEIEQSVAEVLCESLAVNPEKITQDARIIKDLGAE
jgi:acyl carrier protein